MKKVHLIITSYIGQSLGAIHWYGVLKEGYDSGDQAKRKKVTLQKVLTEKDCIELNGVEGNYGYKYRPGYLYEGFNSKEEVIEKALEVWKTEFQDGQLLIRGNPAFAEPQEILIGPEEVKDKINTWWKRCEELGWREEDTSGEVEKISNEFWEYWNKL